MKFTKSQRTLHQQNYNPPCNYYNPSDKINKEILYGSLAGPILMNKRMNTFGYEKRFQDNKFITPGPGQYIRQQSKKIQMLTLSIDKKPNQFLKETLRPKQQFPSIPCHYYDKNMNLQDLQYIKELQLNEDITKASQKTKKKQPSFSFSKSPRTTQKIVIQKKIGHTMQGFLQKVTQNVKQNIPQIKNKQKPFLLWQEAIKKSTQKRCDIINNISPDFVPSLQIIDIMSKQRTKYNPGPGAYQNLEENQFNIIKKKGVIFNSQKRFINEKQSKLGPGFYDIKEPKSTKGISIDKAKRQVFNLKDEVDLYHRFYINPNKNIETKFQEIQASYLGQNKLRSTSCVSIRKQSQISSTPFGSSSCRFSIDTKASTNQQKQTIIISQFQSKRKQNFKKILNNKIKKLEKKQNKKLQSSGLLGISTMASTIDF